MKKLMTALVLCAGSIGATTAMAAPSYQNQHHDNHNYGHHQTHWNQNQSSRHQQINPSRQWRAGQYLPSNYHSSRYTVDKRQSRKLPNPGRNQQWYKINGDYVLCNDKNNRIVRILG